MLTTSLVPNILKVKTKWLLEDCSFMCVFPTDLHRNCSMIFNYMSEKNIQWNLNTGKGFHQVMIIEVP